MDRKVTRPIEFPYATLPPHSPTQMVLVSRNVISLFRWHSEKEPTSNTGDTRDMGSIPGLEEPLE